MLWANPVADAVPEAEAGLLMSICGDGGPDDPPPGLCTALFVVVCVGDDTEPPGRPVPFTCPLAGLVIANLAAV